MPEKTVQLLFELAMSWETQVRDLYANFASLFNHEPEISAFWIQLSKDESGHIDVLKDILKNTPTEKLLTAVVNAEQWNYVTRVEGLIKDTSTRNIQTFDDAYELAHQLEISEINTMFKMLVKDYLPDEQGHTFIMSDFNEHIVRFMKFKKKYTQSEKRRINVRSI